MKRPYERENPWLDRTEQPTKLQIVWSAAFWEGEGSISNTHGSSLQMNASQKYEFCLNRLKKWFGGTIASRKACDDFIWQIASYRAIDFINSIWPFLSPQRRAQIANKLQDIPLHLRKELSEKVHKFTFSG